MRRRFGAPADDVPCERFVVFSQNHDQVGNRAFGDRMPAEARVLAAFCTLLSPFPALVFMGEEYGEPAPFQFFSDHIDPEIAQATREGRREEFAAFAAFSKEKIPDPQDVATFERSKLRRERDEQLANLYRDLLEVRGELPTGDVDAISFDESERWLRVRRGRFELACNFRAGVVQLPCDAQRIRIATSDRTRLADGVLELAPLSGALLRDT
jgi:maltooligosyltrehalose trehalohydrolase